MAFRAFEKISILVHCDDILKIHICWSADPLRKLQKFHFFGPLTNILKKIIIIII